MAYPDIRITIDDMIAAEDKVGALELGRHPPGRNARDTANQSKSFSKRHGNLSIRRWQSRGMDE
jgi:hypothetical protein